MTSPSFLFPPSPTTPNYTHRDDPRHNHVCLPFSLLPSLLSDSSNETNLTYLPLIVTCHAIHHLSSFTNPNPEVYTFLLLLYPPFLSTHLVILTHSFHTNTHVCTSPSVSTASGIQSHAKPNTRLNHHSFYQRRQSQGPRSRYVLFPSHFPSSLISLHQHDMCFCRWKH